MLNGLKEICEVKNHRLSLLIIILVFGVSLFIQINMSVFQNNNKSVDSDFELYSEIPTETAELIAESDEVSVEEVNVDTLTYSNYSEKAEDATLMEAQRKELEQQKILADMASQAEAQRLAEENAEIAQCNATENNVPNWISGCRSEFKSYMGYKSVTNVTSAQYQLLNSDACYTDKNSGIRMVDGRYCIAVGSYYTTTIGTKIDLVMEDGSIVKCILADCKANKDTDSLKRYHTGDGSVVEFIVDFRVFNHKKDSSGTVNFVTGLSGKITKIVVLQ